MEEILKKFNYKPTEENTWVKGEWTVRFDDELVEVFNDPNKSAGEYYSSPIATVDLELILMEVDRKNRWPIVTMVTDMITDVNAESENATGNTYIMFTPHRVWLKDWLRLCGQEENGSYSITGNNIFVVDSTLSKVIDITKLI